ncbi:DUF1648 domain-containing protein [Candidatus Enterococcus mansonii]|uniref:DUF1648 domain-containing protein n=1 Tax=Candidatus Enterococcus mansonii TaxID=1834181 RepID=A0A242CDH5_9ENTE|nr:DUF1648 domain-containing protein [Enterococcus sp. 4G2_DIV0659]OTO07970.1 hypothetical protein A5880_002240 [Enterococcus sp. 4G2_DIV0659]
MKISILKDLAVLLLIIVIIFIVCLFLPNVVPIHFNMQGKADTFINKYFLLFGSVIPYSAYYQFLRARIEKNK